MQREETYLGIFLNWKDFLKKLSSFMLLRLFLLFKRSIHEIWSIEISSLKMFYSAKTGILSLPTLDYQEYWKKENDLKAVAAHLGTSLLKSLISRGTLILLTGGLLEFLLTSWCSVLFHSKIQIEKYSFSWFDKQKCRFQNKLK